MPIENVLTSFGIIIRLPAETIQNEIDFGMAVSYPQCTFNDLFNFSWVRQKLFEYPA